MTCLMLHHGAYVYVRPLTRYVSREVNKSDAKKILRRGMGWRYVDAGFSPMPVGGTAYSFLTLNLSFFCLQ